ncbi:MAG: hypothetical protein R3250_10540 [Melioribacteraceae bacterium]|nr:hypothetical protein [Melioribacteraceae bacterium]
MISSKFMFIGLYIRHSVIACFSFLLISCGSSVPINDFFGIMMNPEEEGNFRIFSYNEVEGIKYQSSQTMDPDINAWAEIIVDKIQIKLVNNSKRPIKLDFFSDKYVIITDERKYNIHKGNRSDYFFGNKLSPGSSAEITFEFPADFSEDFIKRNRAVMSKDIMADYSKNWSDPAIFKDNIKYIVIRLSDAILLLKKVP